MTRRIEQIWPSVGAALGADGFHDSLGLPPHRRYVVVVIDGLGEVNLREHRSEAPFLNSLDTVDDVQCGVPSTTVTSLTSLGTGQRPGVHGMAGYTVRVPESGARLNSIQWDQPVDPLQWQPHPMVLQQLATQGISAATVNEAQFAGSALTVCTQRDVPFYGVSSVWERHDVVVDIVETSDRAAVYAYESRVDHTGHVHGCTSQQWRDVLRSVDREMANLRADLPSDACLLVTADHGMLDLPAEPRFDVDEHPRLLDGVQMLAGEARFRHLYTEPDAAADVARRWREVLGERAQVRLRDDCQDWFGVLDPSVRDRFGDVVVAALEEFAVFSSREFPREMQMAGFHGSVTETEMRIPVLVA